MLKAWLLIWFAGGFIAIVAVPMESRRQSCEPQEPKSWAIQGHTETTKGKHPTQNGQYAIKENQSATKGQRQNAADYYPELLCGEVKLTDLLIAFFTYALVVVGYFTMRSVDNTAKAAERAHIVVTVRLKTLLVPSDTQKNVCEFVIENVGKTVAVITSINGQATITEDLKYPPPCFRKGTIPGGKILSAKDDFAEDAPFLMTKQEGHWVEGISVYLLCFGVIKYQDVFGDSHKTGFCWEYQPRLKDFYLSPNRKLNYRT